MTDGFYEPELITLYLDQTELELRIDWASDITLTLEIDPVVRDPSTTMTPFIHTQTIANATWSISHNKGYKPDVAVYSVGGAEVDASVVHIDNNNTTISFSMVFAGYARLF